MIKIAFLLIIVTLIAGCGTPITYRSRSGHYYAFNSRNAQEDDERHRQKIKANRENYIIQHPELDNETKNLIMCGILQDGMSKDFVLIMYGTPNSIETVEPGEEKWTYGYDPFKSYMYFKDGKLIKTWPGKLGRYGRYKTLPE